jgi:hypothetical protein
LLLGVLAITILAFVNALDGQFVYDDRLQVLKNPTLNSLANIPRMFTQGSGNLMKETRFGGRALLSTAGLTLLYHQ